MANNSRDMDDDEMARLAVAVKSTTKTDAERRGAEADLLHWQMEQKQRQTNALERIADTLELSALDLGRIANLMDGTSAGIDASDTLLGSSVRR